MKSFVTVDLWFRLSDFDDNRDKYMFSRFGHPVRPVHVPLKDYMMTIYALEGLLHDVVVNDIYVVESKASSLWMNTLENQGLYGSGDDELAL